MEDFRMFKCFLLNVFGFAALCLVLPVSCSEPESADVTQVRYFDLDDFFSQEAKRLQNLNLEIKKTIELNGKKEAHQLQIESWEQEFHVFLEANINRSAYFGSYLTDTVFSDSHSFTVRHQAKKTNLSTREIKVFHSMHDEGQKIDSLFVRTHTENLLYMTAQDMWYFPKKGYSLDGEQQIRFLSPRAFKIKAEFL